MSEEFITWIDVETTGVEAFNGDVLLEVACLITDRNLNIMDDYGYQAVIHYSETEVENLKASTVPFVVEMHDKTGLWDRLPDGKPRTVVDVELLYYIQQWVPLARSTRLAGNSITLDRNFLTAYLPGVASHLHYRSIDVSTLAGLAQYWSRTPVKYEKKTLHSAFDDINESIEELRFLRKEVMSI